MWSPIKIQMKNLFSHPDSRYEFKQGACTVIFGRNLSDRSLENNGAGKTTLFEAVCLALTGDSLRKIDKEVFINDAATQCDISFEMYNAVMKMNLRIERHFYRGGKSSRVELYENGVQNTQLVSVAEANKRILDLLGISREDLLRYYIISQDNHYTFFNASDGEKKEIMNRITSADMIIPVQEEIDRRLGIEQEKRATLQRELDKLSERKATLEEQAEELTAENADDGAAWTELEEKARDYDAKAEELRRDLVQLNKDYAVAVKRAEELKCDENAVQEASKRVVNKRQEIEGVEEILSECARIKREIDLFFAGEVTCPSCGEKFVPGDSHLSHDEALKLKSDTEKQEKSFNAVLEKKKKNLQILKDKKRDLEETLEAYQKSQRAVRSIKLNIQGQKDAISSYESRASKARADAKTLREDVAWKKQLEELNRKIAVAGKDIDTKTQELIPVDHELSMLRFWKYNMGRGGFQTYLANKSVKIIEGVTNAYLDRFGVDIRVSINGFKVLKSGEVREKIDVFVSNDGIDWKAFMGKSGGERGRVTLAGVLGIQRLINMSTGGRGLDLLLLDEVLSGVDSGGTFKIINTLETLGTTVMMITQNIEDVSICKNVISVWKENGISKIHPSNSSYQ